MWEGANKAAIVFFLMLIPLTAFFVELKSVSRRGTRQLYTRVIDKRQEKKITSLLYLPIKKDKEEKTNSASANSQS